MLPMDILFVTLLYTGHLTLNNYQSTNQTDKNNSNKILSSIRIIALGNTQLQLFRDLIGINNYQKEFKFIFWNQ
jgi:choline-glycine betaine transporter